MIWEAQLHCLHTFLVNKILFITWPFSKWSQNRLSEIWSVFCEFKIWFVSHTLVIIMSYVIWWYNSLCYKKLFLYYIISGSTLNGVGMQFIIKILSHLVRNLTNLLSTLFNSRQFSIILYLPQKLLFCQYNIFILNQVQVIYPFIQGTHIQCLPLCKLDCSCITALMAFLGILKGLGLGSLETETGNIHIM